MSLHPSLKIDTAGVQQRSVLSRIERIKDLMKKGLWKDDQSVVAKRYRARSVAKVKAQVSPAKPARLVRLSEVKHRNVQQPRV